MNRESRVIIGILVILLSAFLVYDVATSLAGYRRAAGYYSPYGYSPWYGGYGGMMGSGYGYGLENESTPFYPEDMMGMMHGGMHAYGSGYGMYGWNATKAYPYAPGYGG